MEQPSEGHYTLAEILVLVFKFLTKHILGLLSIMFGVVAKVYILRKDYKRISKWQCRSIVFFSGLSGTIAYLGLINVEMIDIKKAIIVGFMPIVVEPIMTRLLVWINPIIDEIGELIKNYLRSKTKKQ